MAKISNKDKYPIDNIISDKDILIGSDGDNTFKTKNFLVRDLKTHILGNGSDGGSQIDGISNGDGTYTWLKYATDINGLGMTDTPTAETLYIGLAYNKTTPSESENPLDYNWNLISGENYWTDANGTKHYTWIKYADTPISGMSDLPLGKAYIGFAFDKITSIESENYADYNWSKVTTNNSTDGVPLVGTSLYTWIKYADDVNGAGISDSPVGKLYIGLAYNKDTYVESEIVTDYLWGLIDGNNVDANGKYTWVKYADTPLTGMSDDPIGKSYLGLSFNNESATESVLYTDYQWSLIKGDANAEITDGVSTPTDSLFTWLKFADDEIGTNLSDSQVGRSYMGLAINKNTSVESLDYTDYVWTLIGDVVSYVGADGKTYYIWVKYADDILGTGLSDSPVGKTYIGLAYRKTTATESEIASDYEWALILGEIQEQPKWLYTWVKFANDSLGNGMSDFPDGKLYMGLAYDRTTATESIDPTDYVWNLITGEQGYTGADGKTYYTWVKYATSPNSAELFDIPDGADWIGMAFNKDTNVESSNYLDYTWYPLSHTQIIDVQAFNQNNLVRVISINIDNLTGGIITEATVAEYLNNLGMEVSEYENIIFDFLGNVVLKVLDPLLTIALSVANITETTANFTWTDSDDAIVKYRLYYTSVIDGSYVETTNKALLLSLLTNNTKYEAFVRGYDITGNWKQSNTVSFETLITYATNVKPIIQATSITESTIDLKWSIDASFAPDNYKVYQTHIPIYDEFETITGYTDNVLIYEGTNLTLALTDLESATDFQFYVIAYRGATASTTSDILNVSTPASIPVLSAPVISLSASDGSSITIKIVVPAIDNITGFKIYYRIYGTTTFKILDANSNLLQTINALNESTYYEIYVVSVNATSISPNSNILKVTTQSLKKANIVLSTTPIATKVFSGSQKRRYTSRVFTTPVFTSPILAGTQIQIYIRFHAKGSISYDTNYNKTFVSQAQYATMEAWFNAEVVSLGTWGSTYTSEYGFLANQFYVTSHRNGTASRDVSTDVFFKVSPAGKLKISNGGASGTVTAKIDLTIASYATTPTGNVTFNTVGGVVTSTKNIVLPLDANGEYTDYFSMNSSIAYSTFTVKGTLLASSNGVDANNFTSQIIYNQL